MFNHRFRTATIRTAIALLAAPLSAALAQPFGVSILAPDGTPQSRFVATFAQMHIDHVMIGPDNNIWLSRADNSHSRGVPNPNDMVAVYDLAGNELRIVNGGGMRHPYGIGWDSGGNIYITGEDIFFASNIYKYDSGGNFQMDFRTAGWNLIDIYHDIDITGDDRVYVSSWHGLSGNPQMTEFDVTGATVRTFSFTGPSYFHRDVALSPTNTLWVRTPKNGPGDDLMREFDLNGSEISAFSTSAAIPGSRLIGLEVAPGGNLFTLDANTATLYELSPAGVVVSQTPLSGLSNWITDFTFAPGGEILVANQLPPCAGDLDGDGDTDLADLGILLADFGCTGGMCVGDLDGDGDTDLADLGILLADFGCAP